MRNIRVLSAAALLAVGVIGCESRTMDNDIDGTDRTTSTRIDSGSVTNDRMSTGNATDRVGRTPVGGSMSTGGTITNENAGIDRAGTGTSNNGIGTGTGTGGGAGASGAGGGR
jgi:hypothetical protein